MKPVSIFAIPANLPDDERLKRRHMLARLGLAWLVMMQVMMFAFPGYVRDEQFGDSQAQLDAVIVVMNWISLALTIPVILYCASPVWSGLFKKNAFDRWVNMDWPVALGIVVSFVPSAMATWTQEGEVYFESIAMFVAFLLTARYLEFAAKQSATFSPGLQDRHLEQSREQWALHADRVAFVFVSVQVLLAVATGMLWYFQIDSAHALPVTVSLFVMSCPCAMAMAVPTAASAARAIFLYYPQLSPMQKALVLQRTQTCAYQNLYGSLIWHLLMTPLAMAGIVAPWLAAITMLVSSLAVAWNAYRLYRKFIDNEQACGQEAHAL